MKINLIDALTYALSTATLAIALLLALALTFNGIVTFTLRHFIGCYLFVTFLRSLKDFQQKE